MSSGNFFPGRFWTKRIFYVNGAPSNRNRNSNWKLINWFDGSRTAEERKFDEYQWAFFALKKSFWLHFSALAMLALPQSSPITSHSLSSMMFEQQQCWRALVKLNFNFFYYSARKFFSSKWDVINDIIVSYLPRSFSCIKDLASFLWNFPLGEERRAYSRSRFVALSCSRNQIYFYFGEE